MNAKKQYYPHMKFLKLDLLTLLISLFLFASCENTSTIGLQVDPSIAVKGVLTDTITINSRTIADEVASTDLIARHPFGYIKDPIFGTTESSLSMTVNLPVAAYNFGTTPLIDSVVLVLNYGTNFYGDSTSIYNIEVRQLNFNLSRETSFPSTREYSSYSQLLGSKSGRLFPNTRIKVTDIVTPGTDTTRSATPQLRIPIDKDFIQANIIDINAENRKTNANFTRFFSGLQVTLNKTGSTGTGGIAFFDFAGSNSSLVLYYKKVDVSTTLKDTVQVAFPIATASNPVVATIKHDYTGTPVATQLANPTTPYSETYLQPLSGVRNKISFPYLSKFAANVGKIVVNKAELVIDVANGSDILPFVPAPRLALYRYDLAERRQNVPDNDQNDGRNASRGLQSFGGYYNILTKQYVFDVSLYIQDLLDGKIKDYGTFLAPSPLTEYQVSSSVSTAARAILGTFKKNPGAGDKVMKLNIYYTKIN